MPIQMISNHDKQNSLAGRLLVATPLIQESCFTRSVIYMCAHNEAGAMGVIINNSIDSVSISDVFDQLSIRTEGSPASFPIHFGGPVESNRGFVLHSSDVVSEDSVVDGSGIALTASLSMLQMVAEGHGPADGMLLLGYAGWSAQQLESEIESGSWIVVPATQQLVFGTDNDLKWSVAMSSLGIDIGHLSTDIGHA
ncbi:MAG: DUF179 domain-containing protein [Proteobacteria bacterium]|nr:DUF179 domain-containing protein [Pseudomonadota bacterium]